MKKTGLDIYETHLRAMDPSETPKNDGEILFKSINRFGTANDSVPLIKALKEIGIRDEMDREEIVQILQQAQKSPITRVVLSRGFINTLIGLCEDDIYTDETGKKDVKKESEPELTNETLEDITDRIVEIIFRPFVNKAVWNISFKDQFRRRFRNQKKDSK